MVLTEDIRGVLASGVSIVLASRDMRLQPSIARAIACRVVGARADRLRVIASAAQAGRLLDDVRESGIVAATFSVPTTHRALQFKGNDAHIEAADASDREAIALQVPAFAARIAPLGFDSAFVQAFFAASGDEVAVEFTPADAFQQTPGPNAGARLA